MGEQPGPQQALTYQLGDGGNLDNSGLMAMLQRRASKIAMMLNTAQPLSASIDFCNSPPGFDPSDGVAGDLGDKFGFLGPQLAGAMFYGRNQVFAKEDLQP